MGTATQRERRKAAKKGTRRRLTNVQVDEISLVDRPAVPTATFVIAKRGTAEEIADADATEQDTEVVLKDQTTDGGDGSPEAKDEQVVAKDGGEPAMAGMQGMESDMPDMGDMPKKPKMEMEMEMDKAVPSVAAAFVTAIQSLRGVAGSLPAHGLRQLACLMEYTGGMYGDSEEVAAELYKCETEVLDRVGEIVAKAKQAKEELAKVDEPATETAEMTESPADPPVDPPAEPPVVIAAEAATEIETAPAPALVTKTEDPLSVLAKASAIMAQRQAARAEQAAEEARAATLNRIKSIAARLEENLSRATSLGKKLDKAMGTAS